MPGGRPSLLPRRTPNSQCMARRSRSGLVYSLGRFLRTRSGISARPMSCSSAPTPRLCACSSDSPRPLLSIMLSTDTLRLCEYDSAPLNFSPMTCSVTSGCLRKAVTIWSTRDVHFLQGLFAPFDQLAVQVTQDAVGLEVGLVDFLDAAPVRLKGADALPTGGKFRRKVFVGRIAFGSLGFFCRRRFDRIVGIGIATLRVVAETRLAERLQGSYLLFVANPEAVQRERMLEPWQVYENVKSDL